MIKNLKGNKVTQKNQRQLQKKKRKVVKSNLKEIFFSVKMLKIFKKPFYVKNKKL